MKSGSIAKVKKMGFADIWDVCCERKRRVVEATRILV